ncbi:MAG: hypothetical protein Q9160_003673 [Pyrenula sp. 1 TL-2023]
MLQQPLQSSPPALKEVHGHSNVPGRAGSPPRASLDLENLIKHNLQAQQSNAKQHVSTYLEHRVNDPTNSRPDLSALRTATLSPPPDSDTFLRRSSSVASLPRRTPSIRTTLYSNAGSLSPGSTISSPQLAAMVDLTPLPSPIGIGKDPFKLGLYTRSRNSSAASKNDLQIDVGLSTAPPSIITPKKKQYPSLRPSGRDAQSPNTGLADQDNPKTQSTPRSVSDYVPEPIVVPKLRNIVVSSSATPIDVPSGVASLQREEYLAEKRGVATPIQQQPTPPPSWSRDSINKDAGREQPMQELYTATSVLSGHSKRYRRVRLLGEGTFSKVYLAVRQVPGSEDGIDWSRDSLSLTGVKVRALRAVAIKVIERGPAGGADKERIEVSLKREVELLKAISHPCLVHLKAFGSEEERALLVLNYCPGGDMFDVASQKPQYLVPGLIRRIFSELVSAVRYLHQNFIVHRDLKLENMLLSLPLAVLPTISDWQTLDRPVVTITDLGLSRRIPKPPESPLLETRCGSEDYAAPELLMGQQYDGRQTDAWALGVVLYALMEGRLPFDPLPGARGDPAKLKARTPHRIARCEWAWFKLGDEDTEWDPVKGKDLEGARECVESLLKRVTRRKPLDEIAAMDWVAGGINVPEGLARVEEETL